MRLTKSIIMIVFILILVFNSVTAGEGNVSVELGYLYTDEQENLGINQETYNLFNGFNFSLKDLSYTTNNGINFNADFTNLLLDNRNLSVSSYKSGLYSVAAFNNNYFRSYNSDKSNKTERNSYGFSSTFTPHKNFKLFGKYNVVDKAGTIYNDFGSLTETNLYQTDYSHTTYSIGGQGFCPYGNLRFEYQKSEFDDKLISNFNRESEQITLSAFSEVPSYRNLHLMGGYTNRIDKMPSTSLELKTDQLWAGGKFYYKKQTSLEYRFRFARTKHNNNLKETDNWINTVTIGKTWKRDGGIRFSYENRVVDDLIDRTVSNGCIVDGWYKPSEQFFVKGKFSIRDKDVKTGSTLIGTESFSRQLLTVRYNNNKYGIITARVDNRIRKNDDINSRVDYTSLTTVYKSKSTKYGSLNMTYSYYIGQYENTQDQIGYEFNDHVITGNYILPSFKKINLTAGGTYYRSERQQDIEKFTMNFTGKYEFIKDHQFVLRYDVFNYDNYLLYGNYYTANIVEVKIIKEISL